MTKQAKTTLIMISLLSSLIYNNACYAIRHKPIINDGIYLNAGLAVNWLKMETYRSVTFKNTSIGPPPNVNFADQTNTFAGGKVALGYQKILNDKYYFGAEFAADLFSHSNTATKTFMWPQVMHTFTETTQIDTPLRIELHGGYLIRPSSTLYLSFGAAMADATYHFKKSTPIYTPETTHQSWLPGISGGIGFAQQLTKHLMLRTDYAYTGYPSKEFTDQLALYPINKLSISNKYLTIHTQQLALSLSYVF